MFENNSEGASISQKEYIDICDCVMRKLATENVEMKQDFKIGSYFKLIKHCDGVDTEELSFVHRSIYEYFVVETICSSIEDAMFELSENSQKDLAAHIVIYLKEGQLTDTIKNYLQYKILKIYDRLNDKKRAGFYLWWEETINKMMNYGMFYYTNVNVQNYIDIIKKETQCFINLMEILRLLIVTGKQEFLMENANKKQLEKYIRLSLMLSQAKIVSLYKMCLANIDLSGVNLTATDSRRVCFCNTDLQRANLRGLSLIGANLEGANLKGASLEGAVIDRCQVEYLEKKCDLRGVNVYFEGTGELITYDELCKGVK